MLDRRALIAGAAAPLGACAVASSLPERQSLLVDLDRAPDFEIDLWPNGAPGGAVMSLNEHYVERVNPYGLPDRAAHEVTRPTLSAFRAKNPDGSAILIISGGGYSWVVVEKEGFEGARLFSRYGSTVYVLKYRLPHQGWGGGPDTPLQDAQRAMRVIRSRAHEDGIDPARILTMGFSAGGHVAGSVSARFDERVYDPVDAADRLSARPDATALIYPVVTMKAPHTHAGSRRNLIGDAPAAALVEKYSLETSPPADTPPTFLMHAADDAAVPVENSLALFAALKSAGIPAAMHVFEKGGHGFGVRGVDDAPLRRWPSLVLDWAAAHGVCTASAGP